VPPFEVQIPRAVAWAVGWVAEKVTWATGTEATISRGSVKDYTQTAYADIRRAKEILKYKPRVSMAGGLKISCDELKLRIKAAEEKKKN
jgi:sterol-4alpha-carboxylate 3-dehydrogenase (decarboxylating)